MLAFVISPKQKNSEWTIFPISFLLFSFIKKFLHMNIENCSEHADFFWLEWTNMFIKEKEGLGLKEVSMVEDYT